MTHPPGGSAITCTWEQTLNALERATELHRNEPGNLLPILHAVQGSLGHIPDRAIGWLATQLQLSRAEIQGVISFYHDFRQSPPAKHNVRLCMAESCMAMGAQHLLEHARGHLNCDADGLSADGNVHVQAVYCLGLCAQSPAAELDGQQYARLDTTRFDKLVAEKVHA